MKTAEETYLGEKDALFAKVIELKDRCAWLDHPSVVARLDERLDTRCRKVVALGMEWEDRQSSHSLSRLHPPPGPWQRGCTPLTPTRGYTPVHITPITPENNNKNNSCQSSLLAATRPSNTHEGGGCGCCCGLGVDTDAPDAIGGQCARL